jgi:hypothetical protein
MRRYRLAWYLGLALSLEGCASTNQTQLRPPVGGGSVAHLEAKQGTPSGMSPMAGGPQGAVNDPRASSSDVFANGATSPRLTSRLWDRTSRLIPMFGSGTSKATADLLRPGGQDIWAETAKLNAQVRAQALRSRETNLAQESSTSRSDEAGSVLPVALEVGAHSVRAKARPTASAPRNEGRSRNDPAPSAASGENAAAPLPPIVPAERAEEPAPAATLPAPIEPSSEARMLTESRFLKVSAIVIEGEPAADDEPAKPAPPTAPPPRTAPEPRAEPKPAAAEPAPAATTPAPAATTPAPEPTPAPAATTPEPSAAPAKPETPETPAPAPAATTETAAPQTAAASPAPQAPSKSMPGLPKVPSKTLPVAVAPKPSQQAKTPAAPKHCRLIEWIKHLKGHHGSPSPKPSAQAAAASAPAPAPASPQRVAFNPGDPYGTVLTSIPMYPPSYYINPGADAARPLYGLRAHDSAVATAALAQPKATATATAPTSTPPEWLPMKPAEVGSPKKSVRVSLAARLSWFLSGEGETVERHPLHCDCGAHPTTTPSQRTAALTPASALVGRTEPGNLPQGGQSVQSVAVQSLDKPAQR